MRFEAGITPADDLPGLLAAAAPPLIDGDVVVVSHKAVSKWEGRVVDLATVEPSDRRWSWRATAATPGTPSWCCARAGGSSAARGSLLIAETHHGFVCASAGIDRSNAPGADMAILLPARPGRLSPGPAGVAPEQTSGARLAVVIADTMGRPLPQRHRRHRHRRRRHPPR